MINNKCTGIMGLIFGHKWNEEVRVIPADSFFPGVFYMHGERHFQVMMENKCQRCGTVMGEKK